ncbi:MAG: GntR family transcriptional regulator [Chloroflexi bacterium]|nr:GntR family transcriptional regulator [Chloroflexota bacterium]
MNIHVDRERGAPVYLQIVEQVKFLIETDVLQPGEKLPTAQALARQVGVHINTVARAYAQLASSGYIVSKYGSGTYVELTRKDSEAFQSRRKLRSIVEKALQDVQAMGYSGDEFLNTAEIVVQTFAAIARRRAAFVECHEAWLNEVAQKLGDELDMDVEPFLLGKLQTDPQLQHRLRQREVVITMISHVEDVQQLLKDGRKVYSIVLYPSVEVVKRIASLRARRIGVLFAEDVVQRLAKSFQGLGLQTELEAIPLSDDNALAKLARGYDALLIASADRNRFPEELAGKIIEIQTTLARESVDLLKRDLVDGPPRSQDG